MGERLALNITETSIRATKLETQIHGTESKVDPDNLATFQIGLTERQKIERSRTELPFTRVQSQGLEIIYHYEIEDDYDEDDPDADLEI